MGKTCVFMLGAAQRLAAMPLGTACPRRRDGACHKIGGAGEGLCGSRQRHDQGVCLSLNFSPLPISHCVTLERVVPGRRHLAALGVVKLKPRKAT